MIYTYYIHGTYYQYDIPQKDIDDFTPVFDQHCRYNKKRKRYIYRGLSHQDRNELKLLVMAKKLYKDDKQAFHGAYP